MNELQEVQEIRKLYNEGAFLATLQERFGKLVVKHALAGHRQSKGERWRSLRKMHPETFKMSDEAKQRISIARKKYLDLHPEKVPYRLNHSSKISWPEKIFESALKRHDITGWVRNYMNGRYEYDFAFPMLKIDVEIDGNTHSLSNVKKIDCERDNWSKSQGWIILRFTAKHVLRDVNQCIELLQKQISNMTLDVNDEINASFLMLRTAKDRYRHALKERRQQRSVERAKKIEELQQNSIQFNENKKIAGNELSLETILDRVNIAKNNDQEKRGYVSELSELWKVSSTQVRRFLKQYCPECLRLRTRVFCEQAKFIKTDEVVKQIISDYKNGDSLSQICKKYIVLKKIVKQLLLDNHVEIRDKRYYAKRTLADRHQKYLMSYSDKLTDIVKDHDNGCTIRELRRKYNISRTIIKKLLNLSDSDYKNQLQQEKLDKLEAKIIQKQKLQNQIKQQQQRLLKQKRKLKRRLSPENQQKMQDRINCILKSEIDYSSFGWVNKVSVLIGLSPQKVNGWMKKYMSDFYDSNCFKKRDRKNILLSNDVIEQIVSDYKNSKSLRQICKKYDVSKNVVKLLLLSRHIEIRSR